MTQLWEGGTEATEIALSAGTERALLTGTATSSVSGRIIGWGVSFDGVTIGNDPVKVYFERSQTSGSGGTITERKWDPDLTGGQKLAMRSDGVPVAEEWRFQVRFINPQQGFELWYPRGREIKVPGVGGDIAAHLHLVALAPQAVNCHAWWVFSSG